MPSSAPLLAAALLVASLVVVPAVAQTVEEPARVLILGTYHFANPGLDVIKTDVADVLSEEKQEEVKAIVDALLAFRPTRVAVERPLTYAPVLDSLYGAFRAGSHTLTRSETEQIGFRVAAELEHERLYPIDYPGDFPFGAVMAYAAEHDTAFVSFVQQEMGRITSEMNRQQREHKIGEILTMANQPLKLAADHAFYLRLAGVGAGDGYAGAALLSKWYERNIHIFTNIQRIAGPGERLLVIIGAGHAPILRELVRSNVGMELVEAVDYLPFEIN